MSDPNMDNSPDSEADTVSGGPAEPRDEEGSAHDTATGVDAPRATNPPDRDVTTDDDGTPVENPSG